MKNPTFHFERDLAALGYKAVVGVDEVGCGALAGPVVAGAVILQEPFRLAGVRDSKLLTPLARERLSLEIKKRARVHAIGEASVDEINKLGIRRATFLAMRRALEKIGEVDFVLVDAWKIPGIPFQQKGIIRGDRLIKSIAAASIVAKVYRDALMDKLSLEFPKYSFHEHKGYSTEVHLSAIKEYGPCPIHRTSWKRFQPKLFD
ncbi:MAG: ribonuclease HII [Patescibacteria group bacterium]|jgi:ribonuclease HII